MKTLILLLTMLPPVALAGELPFSGAYCSPGGLVVSRTGVSMPEVGCDAPKKIEAGYLAKCPTSEVGKITFTLTKQPDGGYLYSDDYWGKEALHACRQ